ncbi:MAG: RHS repeat-associated core domain-containing protein, partial [Candidatus Bathyarchaeota archaeon]|nr:RHS repeat-associated core domain-containing protein [Candidatus Termitimicrobium sp.]
TQTLTGHVELSADTVYVLEFEYWSYGFTGMFYAGLIPDDYRMWLTPTATVQRARFEIDSNDLRWLNSRLRFVTYGQSGRVYVANVRFYNRDAMESARPPQGSTRASTDLDNNPFRFAGEYFCRATGMIYLRARDYQPRTGRFTQPDPYWGIGNMQFGATPITMGHGVLMPNQFAIAQSSNLFAFCVNNPIMFHDPSGKFITLKAALAALGISALVGGGINAGVQYATTGSVDVRGVAGGSASAATFTGLMMVPGGAGVKFGFWGSMAWAGAAGGFSYTVNHAVAGTPATWQGSISAATMSAAFASAGFAVTARTAPSTGNFLSSPARRNGMLNIGAGARPVDGAFNVDIDPRATGVFRGNVNSLGNVATRSQSQVIIANPQFNSLTPEVRRVMQSGGVLNITGGRSNSHFKQIFNMTPQQLQSQGFTLISRGQIAPNNPGLRTDGTQIRGALYQILLQRN